jgi:hypothetical protein
MLGIHKRRRPPATVVAVAIGAIVVVGAGSAEASSLMTGREIKPHSITGVNIKHRTLHRIDFTKHAITMLEHGHRGKKGARGQKGARGARGARGPAGAAGAPATFSPLPWGIIGRNTIGSPVAQYRVGPGTPPLGIGSLGIEVAGPPNGDTNPADAQKISFGVTGPDFATETGITNPKAITSLSYSVYTDMDYSAGITPPGITIESNPDISDGSGPITYTSLVYVPPTPDASQVQSWQTYDTTGPATSTSGWFATGRAGTATGCTLAAPCTLSTLQAALGANASILTFAIAKGRDNAFIGGVDDVKVNSSTYDFEPLGVTEH